jgi:proteasome-associated ATPase
LIGQAAASSLSKLVKESGQGASGTEGDKLPVTRGAFLHVKGPEILNMWLGESERMVRDLFAQARARRSEGALPFIFIDEAESILGTRRASRSFNISSTLVPMFCAEMDGIESLRDVVIILASNRPDLIDPAVLRPGRVDRKIKVSRPNRDSAAAILNVYLTDDLPMDRQWIDQHGGDRKKACAAYIDHALSAIFAHIDENRLLSIRLRSGQNKVLYRSDLISGAILASIVQRAKEQAIDRMIGAGSAEQGGMTLDDLMNSVQSEFREGEMLPPDDAAEEWLKLLDHHPEQVVGVSSFRRGRQSEEKLINQII